MHRKHSPGRVDHRECHPPPLWELVISSHRLGEQACLKASGMETLGNRDGCLEKCKRGEEKGKIKSWEIFWPEKMDSSYLSVALSNSPPFRCSCICDLCSEKSALAFFHLTAGILNKWPFLTQTHCCLWPPQIMASPLLLPDAWLLSISPLSAPQEVSFIPSGVFPIGLCSRAAFLTTCLSDHCNWQEFTFYSTLGKQLPYGKHILFDVGFIQELILVIITVSHSGLLLFFLYFPAGLFEA